MTVATHGPSDTGSTSASARTYLILLYSDRPEIRDRFRQAIGTKPAPGTKVQFVDASTYDECINIVDQNDVSLLVLDGEAQPAGGLGISRQLRDEVDDCPPICVAIARTADRWLAAYAKVEGVLVHPLDPITTGRTVADLLRR